MRCSTGQLQAIEELDEIITGAGGTILQIGDPYLNRVTGALFVRLSLDFGAGTATSPEDTASSRARLAPREQVTIRIPVSYPFDHPATLLPRGRFAKQMHVQWDHRLCLYQSPNDWDPNGGMLGHLERLVEWYVRAAEGTLAAAGQPLHPPIEYASSAAGHVIVCADFPYPADRLWLGAAVLEQASAARTDVVGWVDPATYTGLDSEELRSALAATAPGNGRPRTLGPAIILPRPLGFEFPQLAGDLAGVMSDQGVPVAHLARLLSEIYRANARAAQGTARATAALTVVIGAPMRGVSGDRARLTHITAWRLRAGSRLLNILRSLSQAHDAAAVRRTSAQFSTWARATPISWAVVHEQRPQIVTRRDAGRPAAWLKGRGVAILGCGALGARISEHCVRGGVTRILLADSDWVTPGILVRQPFEDRDIGSSKVDALGARLMRIRPDAQISISTVNVISGVLGAALPKLLEFDLIVDATANRTVMSRIEYVRWASKCPWPPLLTVGVGHDCQRGIGVLSHPQATGAAADALHRLALHAHVDRTAMADVLDDFFPARPRDPFQPEPGCSAPTFRGADFEAAAHAAGLFSWGIAGVQDPAAPAELFIHRLTSRLADDKLSLDNDHVFDDPDSGYQIRVRQAALQAMRAAARRVPPLIETGGILLGHMDDAARVAWATWAGPPPPDSEHAQHFFRCGLQGVAETVTRHRERTGGHTRFLGLWHTHPGTPASMSATDQTAMRELLVPVPRAPRRAIILILGGREPRWTNWLENDNPPEVYATLCRRTAPLIPR